MALALVFCLDGTAGAWSGITHYHINRSVGVEPAAAFGMSGTGPDMSIEWIGRGPSIPDEKGDRQNWSDYFHSPNPKITGESRPFADKPNFGYLMLKVSEKNGSVSDEERARALGWGGHNAADWVAHSDNLFPICPKGTRGEKKHFIGECLYDMYSFITRGPMYQPLSVLFVFDDRQIYKALFNYRLISIHENYLKSQKVISEEIFKKTALETTLPKSFIRGRILRWSLKMTLVQFAYAKSPVAVDPAKRLKFLVSMQKKQVESNLALSEMSVNAWTNVLTPRGSIPDFAGQVVPYYKKPLMAVPAGLSLSGATFRAAATSPEEDWVSQETNSISADEEDALLWDAIIDSACAKGLIAIDETETPDGLYSVNVSVIDEQGLLDEVAGTIERVAADSAYEEPLGVFWKRLLIEGEADPDRLADLSGPTITDPFPLAGSFINLSAPEVRARIGDDPFGTGVDTESVTFTIDGVEAAPRFIDGLASYRPQTVLADGVHQVLVSARDLAGNKGGTAWTFTVDTVGPRLCYNVKNRIINSSRPRAEVLVLPDEPVSYVVRIHPIVGGYPDYGTVLYESELPTVSAEQRQILWSGVDSNGNRVAAGDYMMRINAYDR
ncbi:MAG: Ig-like domain-containing protein, partial [Candidatus Aquicultor sp.]|nr:Ig-like domain-containing protein [Candidatus Aquicultor sp.]